MNEFHNDFILYKLLSILGF